MGGYIILYFLHWVMAGAKKNLASTHIGYHHQSILLIAIAADDLNLSLCLPTTSLGPDVALAHRRRR